MYNNKLYIFILIDCLHELLLLSTSTKNSFHHVLDIYDHICLEQEIAVKAATLIAVQEHICLILEWLHSLLWCCMELLWQ